jgi:hypothetical protein
MQLSCRYIIAVGDKNSDHRRMRIWLPASLPRSHVIGGLARWLSLTEYRPANRGVVIKLLHRTAAICSAHLPQGKESAKSMAELEGLLKKAASRPKAKVFYPKGLTLT